MRGRQKRRPNHRVWPTSTLKPIPNHHLLIFRFVCLPVWVNPLWWRGSVIQPISNRYGSNTHIMLQSAVNNHQTDERTMKQPKLIRHQHHGQRSPTAQPGVLYLDQHLLDWLFNSRALLFNTVSWIVSSKEHSAPRHLVSVGIPSAWWRVSPSSRTEKKIWKTSWGKESCRFVRSTQRLILF